MFDTIPFFFYNIKKNKKNIFSFGRAGGVGDYIYNKIKHLAKKRIKRIKRIRIWFMITKCIQINSLVKNGYGKRIYFWQM